MISIMFNAVIYGLFIGTSILLIISEHVCWRVGKLGCEKMGGETCECLERREWLGFGRIFGKSVDKLDNCKDDNKWQYVLHFLILTI